jgi:lysophospholipase L1-like esterase
MRFDSIVNTTKLTLWLVLLRTLLLLGGLLFGGFLGEAALQLADRSGAKLPHMEPSVLRTLPDAGLGHRIAPFQAGHDGNGFRNPAILQHADIVTIGDSQTWGINAGPSETWPAVLGQMTNRSIYNMGISGYGPVEYWILLEKALSLSPDTVVVGLYLGNDLYDAYRMVYQQQNAQTNFYRPDAPSSLYSDEVAERLYSDLEQRGRFQSEFPSPWWYALEQGLLNQSVIARLIEQHGFLDPVELAYKYRRDRDWAEAFPNDGMTYSRNRVRAVLTTTIRLEALDLEEPRIAEGLRITEEILRSFRDKSNGAGSKLMVLLLPTKESVHADVVKGSYGGLGTTYARLVDMERRAGADILSHCETEGITCIEVLPALQQAIDRDEQIYPSHLDGHPNPHGYSVIGSAVTEILKSLGW